MTNMVVYEVNDQVATIRLNRPEVLNAVVPELIEGLVHALRSAIRDSVSVAILGGEGRAFCAGFDLKYERGHRSETQHRRQLDAVQDVTRLIRRADFPVITAVHGYALGQGCEFALAGDIVVAAEGTSFGFPEVSWGLSVTGGISQLLVAAIGPYRAKNLLFSSRRFDAAEAYEWGLVAEVAPADGSMKIAERIASELLELPQAGILRAKRSIDLATAPGIEWAYAMETEHSIIAGHSKETAQAVSDFGEVEGR